MTYVQMRMTATSMRLARSSTQPRDFSVLPMHSLPTSSLCSSLSVKGHSSSHRTPKFGPGRLMSLSRASRIVCTSSSMTSEIKQDSNLSTASRSSNAFTLCSIPITIALASLILRSPRQTLIDPPFSTAVLGAFNLLLCYDQLGESGQVTGFKFRGRNATGVVFMKLG